MILNKYNTDKNVKNQSGSSVIFEELPSIILSKSN